MVWGFGFRVYVRVLVAPMNLEEASKMSHLQEASLSGEAQPLWGS